MLLVFYLLILFIGRLKDMVSLNLKLMFLQPPSGKLWDFEYQLFSGVFDI